MTEGRVTVVGLGILPARDLTVGAIDALRGADHSLYLGADADLGRYLSTVTGREVKSVNDLYHESARDLDNYERIVARVTEGLVEGRTYAFGVPGSPGVGVTLVDLLRGRLGSQVEFYPGISSFDSVLLDIAVDPLERGCVVVDANRLLLFDFDHDPRLGMLIYHSSSVGTSRTNFREPWRSNRLELLQQKLLTVFGAARRVEIVRSRSGPQDPGLRLGTTVAELGDHVRSIDYASTLYVYPGPVEGIDESLLRELMSDAAITKPRPGTDSP